jgi:hypothetical protein
MIIRCLGKGRVRMKGKIRRRIPPMASQIHLFLFPPMDVFSGKEVNIFPTNPGGE